MAKKAETVQTTNYYVIYDTLKTSWKMAEKLSLTFILLWVLAPVTFLFYTNGIKHVWVILFDGISL